MHSVSGKHIPDSELKVLVRFFLTCSLILGKSLNMGGSFSICKLTGWVQNSPWFLPLQKGGELSVLKAIVALPKLESAGVWLSEALSDF